MAPALTQDSQSELLLPYLTTPPYTPSPPGSGVVSAHHINLTRNNICGDNNMEQDPSGGILKHQHITLPTTTEPSRDTTTHHHSNDDDNSNTCHLLKDEHNRFKLDFETSPCDTSRPITLSQPTPPHSTDSSAPLSPLPSDKTTLFAKLHENNRDHQQPQDDSSLHVSHLTNTNESLNLRPLHINTSTLVPQTSLANTHQFLESGLPSPRSPIKDRTASSSSPVNLPVSLPCIRTAATTITATAISSYTTSFLPSSSLLNIPLSTPKSVPPNASFVDTNNSTLQTSVTQGIQSSQVSVTSSSLADATLKITLETSAPTVAMGCTLHQVENTVTGRCSAPQPNDTPPPYFTKLKMSPPITTLIPATVVDLNIPLCLPDEVVESLGNMIGSNLELFNEVNQIDSIASTAGLILQNSVSCSQSNGVIGTSGVVSGSVLTTFPSSSSLQVSSMQRNLVNQNVTSTVPGQQQIVPSPLTAEQQASHLLSTLSVKQLRLQKRRSQLLRRVRRVTGRALASNVSTQLQSLLTYSNKLLLQDGNNVSVDVTEKTTSVPVSAVPDYDATTMKAMSTASLVSYVREKESKSNSSSRSCNIFSSDVKMTSGNIFSTDNISTSHDTKESEQLSETVISPHVASELQTVSGEMRAAARLHAQHDSDATESSSGGESCDEMDGYDDIHTQAKPM